MTEFALLFVIATSVFAVIIAYKKGYEEGHAEGTDAERKRLLQELVDRELMNPYQKHIFN